MTKRKQELSQQAGERRENLNPREALALLKSLEAPVAPVDVMIEESVAGRDSTFKRLEP